MAKENAKALVEKIMHDADLKAAFLADPRAALAAGDYGCTLEELKAAAIMNRELDDDELDTINGGKILDSAEHRGGCEHNYYTAQCRATWEKGSGCASNDFCYDYSVEYDLSDYVIGGEEEY